MRKFCQIVAVPVIFAVAAVGFAEQIDNPAYKSWAKYKPGTSVTLRQFTTVSMVPEMGTDTVITQKLVGVKPDGATLEITMKTTMMGRTTENKTSGTVAAKIEKGEELIPQRSSDMKVEMKDLKEGREIIEVRGVKMHTITHEFSLTIISFAAESAGSGTSAVRPAGGTSVPMTAQVKTWTSGAIPGGTAKVEQYMDMGALGDIKTIMTLVDYTIAK